MMRSSDMMGIVGCCTDLFEPAAASGSVSAERTKCFFAGLLPEGFTRKAIAEHLHLHEDDYAEILYRLGRECIGALHIHQKDEAPKAQYEELALEKVRQLASEGASESAAIVIESRQSLAGATGKAGLYRDPRTGECIFPMARHRAPISSSRAMCD